METDDLTVVNAKRKALLAEDVLDIRSDGKRSCQVLAEPGRRAASPLVERRELPITLPGSTSGGVADDDPSTAHTRQFDDGARTLLFMYMFEHIEGDYQIELRVGKGKRGA